MNTITIEELMKQKPETITVLDVRPADEYRRGTFDGAISMPMKEIPEEKIHAYYNLCRNLKLHITESNPYENAQVSAGGVDVREIKPTMESKICPGVYFAGGILDVDGRCGGYNLQWAWSSGYLAGYHAALA